MATENPIRMPESGKWPSKKEAITFSQSSANITINELLLKEHRFTGIGRDVVPGRSGSAPPSMEGSFLAISSLISQQNPNFDGGFAGINNALENCVYEEQLRADPAYLEYYCSNVNMNPRLPPPLISWENRHMVRHIGSFGNKRELSPLDDRGCSSLFASRGALPTHKEEFEEDVSPKQAAHGRVERTSGLWSEKGDSKSSQFKSVVGLIQGDCPRSPSPVYSQAPRLSHSEEAVCSEADTSSLTDSPVVSVNLITSSPDVDDEQSLGADPSVTVVPQSSSVVLKNTSICVQGEELPGDVNMLDDSIIESGMKSLLLSSLSNSERPNYQGHQSCQNISVPNQIAQQSNSTNCSYIGGIDQAFRNPSTFSSQAEPVMQSCGFTPPLYANAAYMTSANSFYSNLHAAGLFPPPYGLGGYMLNSNDPPYIAAYPPQTAIPLGFDGIAPSFNAQMAGGSSAHVADIQHLNKLYGQLGFPVQPSHLVPHYMQYYQQPFADAYSTPVTFTRLPSGGSIVGNRAGAHNSCRGSGIVSYSHNMQIQHQRAVGPNSRKVGMMSSNHYRNSQNIPMPYSASRQMNPVFPGSPGPSLSGGRNEERFPFTPGGSANTYSGWQGQRAFERDNYPKICNFLEDLKSGKGRRFELSDITGHIVEFSADQHGSRFIQMKLENCIAKEKASVFKEVLPHASKLMTDVFGNYVIQKFFEYGSLEQRKELAHQLTGQILPLSLQMYGCRVIQKALEVIELDQKVQLVRELDGHVIRCVRDQNGNHVIQKCIESVPTEKIGFIISAFHGQVAMLSMHPYGCRVIQRVLERCTDDPQCQFITDEILESVCPLAQDQYGNYVTQHVLESGKVCERSQIIAVLAGHIVQLSQHKFASNVVEKCLEYGDIHERGQLIEEIIGDTEGNDNLLTMVKDQYANYVVQKALEVCRDDQRVLLLSHIRFHVQNLKKYTYGKHIVTRLEQLFGEENQTLES